MNSQRNSKGQYVQRKNRNDEIGQNNNENYQHRNAHGNGNGNRNGDFNGSANSNVNGNRNESFNRSANSNGNDNNDGNENNININGNNNRNGWDRSGNGYANANRNNQKIEWSFKILLIAFFVLIWLSFTFLLVKSNWTQLAANFQDLYNLFEEYASAAYKYLNGRPDKVINKLDQIHESIRNLTAIVEKCG